MKNKNKESRFYFVKNTCYSHFIVFPQDGSSFLMNMFLFQAAPAVTVIALFLVDERVRYNMFNLCAPQHEVQNNENKTD